MFDTAKITDCMKSLVGWKNHYDLTEIPVLNPALNVSDSGLFYNTNHPALRLDIIKASLPPNRTLDSYLAEKVESGITQLLGDVITQKEYMKYAKQTLANDVILDGYGWANDKIINNGRFVGFKFKTKLETGLTSIIKKIGIQVDTPQTLKMYLFHSSKAEVVETFDVEITSGLGWTWMDKELKLNAIADDHVGGVWILGYYQDELVGQAIDYKKFDWVNGPCSICDGGVALSRWKSISQFTSIEPIYVAGANLDVDKEKMFDLNDMNFVSDSNFGMNFKVSVECDLTDFFCEHRFSMKKALLLQVTHSILKDIQFSQQINFVEESIKHCIIRDLEGDKETNYINIVDQLKMEIKAINFDHSSKSAYCLPCDSPRGISIGVA